MQGVLNNALASPNVIGVNAGAGFAVMLLLALLPDYSSYAALAAFLGAFLSAVLIVSIAAKTGAS
ncbi:MAG TPA: iron ABC transporter permease, partial [Dielma fastidiosa]|nr:iron ABC transporter permease [Dielma fastidiosa]